MNDVQKMFRTIVNGMSAMKGELLGEIKKLDKKLDKLDKKVDDVEGRLTKRIDRLGLQLANLEDDCPTRDEFDELEGRVTKIENLQSV